jgi:uroporphyrinogen III methyltransferase/synthase
VPSRLKGRTILVTRAATAPGTKDELGAKLRALGAEVLSLPGIEILPPSSWAPLDAAVARLGVFEWLVFTSQNAVEPFFQRLVKHGPQTIAMRGLRLAAVGTSTARALEARGLEVNVVPAEHVAEALAAALAPHVAGKRLLWPRGEQGRDVLTERLVAAGAEEVAVAPAYRTQTPKLDAGPVRAALAAGRVDAVTLGSARTLRGVLDLLGREGRDWLGRTHVICLGPIVEAACRAEGLTNLTVAKPHTIQGLVKATVRSLK